MNDPLIARFAEACGAAHPLNLRVGLAEGGVLAEGSVQQPFTLIGRDDACDVTLTDPEVNLRHAWFQVVGGRVFAVDLGSRTGLVWPDGANRCGWMEIGIPVKIGPFRVQLRSAPASRPPTVAADYDPLRSDAAIGRIRPNVMLEFRNGKRAKDRWTVNRLVTLVGRSDNCKLHLNGEDISGHHCGLVLTPTGLWVVDLSGRGVVVNGERMRVAPLTHGAELWIGRFLVGCHYPSVTVTPAVGRMGILTPPAPLPGLSLEPSSNSGPRPPKTPPPARPIPVIEEDEVPLGIAPSSDPAAGLPSSHIMADAFRVLSELGLAKPGGPVSSPILVSGSNPPPPHVPTAPAEARPPATEAAALAPNTAISNDSVAGLLLRQLGELHNQMFEQFQQSMLVMMQCFGKMHQEQVAALQQELSRIQDLNAELGRLQSEVARLTMARIADHPGSDPALSVSNRDTVPMIEFPAVRPQADAGAAIQEWVVDRINALQQERQARWQKLVGHFAEPASRG